MRKASVMALVALAFTSSVSAADLSGTWTVSADIAGNALGATCTMAQSSAAITGSCKSDSGESKVTGTSDGQKVQFKYDLEFQGMTFPLTYDGTLDAAGKELKGSVDVGGMAQGTFTAKKQ